MKTEIKLSNILMDYKLGHLTLDEAENKILRLFNVVGRSEQLTAFAEWLEDKGHPIHDMLLQEYIRWGG
jgi:hypothetical protein